MTNLKAHNRTQPCDPGLLWLRAVRGRRSDTRVRLLGALLFGALVGVTTAVCGESAQCAVADAAAATHTPAAMVVGER
jgi:hypothetical protein